MRYKTRRSTLHLSLAQLLRQLNQTLRGWANYFRYGVSKDVFNAIDYHAWRRVALWIHRKHSAISWKQMRHRFCDHGWRFASEGVTFTGAASVSVSRYRYRGNTIPTPWTPKPNSRTS